MRQIVGDLLQTLNAMVTVGTMRAMVTVGDVSDCGRGRADFACHGDCGDHGDSERVIYMADCE